jgi:hypothetical protein
MMLNISDIGEAARILAFTVALTSSEDADPGEMKLKKWRGSNSNSHVEPASNTLRRRVP